MSLFISLNSASRELDDSPIHHAITSLAERVWKIKQAGKLPKEPVLDITFMLPGRFEEAAFEGMRMGRYDHASAILQFEVAVPRHIIDSPQAPYYASMVLLDAVDNAVFYFRDTFDEHGITFDATQWHRALISQIRTGKTEPSNIEEVSLYGACHA